jgi:O-antigen/teichoic acid export membrane protein
MAVLKDGAGAPNAAGTRAARDAVWQMAGFVVLTGSSYIMVMLLARGLGPAAYGVYGVVYATLLAVELISRIGVPQSLAKLAAGNSGIAPLIEATGTTLSLLVSLVALVSFWVAAPWLARLLNVPDGADLFRIAAIDLPIFAVYAALLHVLNGRRNFRGSALATMAYSITKVVGTAIMLAGDLTSIEGALVVNILASIIGLLAILPHSGAGPLRPTLIERRPILTLALPVALADLAMQTLLALDLWSLNALGAAIPLETRGQYVAALNLARIPNLLAYVLVSMLVPMISHALTAGGPEAARRMVLGATRFLSVLVLPACTLIAADASDILALLFSEAYRPGAHFLALLIFAQGLGFTVLNSLQAMLVGAGAADKGAKRIFLALAVGAIFNVTLVPLLGATGAALAALLGLATAAISVAVVVRKRLGVLVEPRVVIGSVLLSLAVGLVAWLVPSGGLVVLVELAGLFLAYLGLAWAVGLIGHADVALLRGRNAG